MTNSVYRPNRRALLRGTAAAGAAALVGTLPARLFAQDAPEKPAEIIVRAWGGSWVEALKKGVSDPFTAATGIQVRHDLTEDNEIQPKVWAAVAQNRVPPIHINWDTTTNATKSALRGVTEALMRDFEDTESPRVRRRPKASFHATISSTSPCA